MKFTMKKLSALLLSLALAVGLLAGCGVQIEFVDGTQSGSTGGTVSAPADGQWNPGLDVPFTVDDIPAYTGAPYAVVNDNQPFFDTTAIPTTSVEYYSPLDELGRCGVTFANVGQDLMPTEKRGDISSVHPTGWINNRYDHVDGKSLYNRCHLLGFQLTGENANELNLITGTRTMNVAGMLPFENMVADFVKEDGGHVAYRVTPIFDGDDLVAQGVLMEGWSVEDAGETVMFCVFAYNIEPGVEIDYATGDNWLAESGSTAPAGKAKYVLNTGSKKFHNPDCTGVDSIKPENRENFTGSRDDLIAQGYEPCKRCNP